MSPRKQPTATFHDETGLPADPTPVIPWGQHLVRLPPAMAANSGPDAPRRHPTSET